MLSFPGGRGRERLVRPGTSGGQLQPPSLQRKGLPFTPSFEPCHAITCSRNCQACERKAGTTDEPDPLCSLSRGNALDGVKSEKGWALPARTGEFPSFIYPVIANGQDNEKSQVRALDP